MGSKMRSNFRKRIAQYPGQDSMRVICPFRFQGAGYMDDSIWAADALGDVSPANPLTAGRLAKFLTGGRFGFLQVLEDRPARVAK